MEHNVKFGDRVIKIEMGCCHPDITGNVCPISSGDCGNCLHCKATLSARDYMFLQEAAASNEIAHI